MFFMNEIGLDHGIDHMSAMKVNDEIREKGGNMLLFESFCGGLVAPESDNNLWNYKFTWAPRNVVLAGQVVRLSGISRDLAMVESENPAYSKIAHVVKTLYTQYDQNQCEHD